MSLLNARNKQVMLVTKYHNANLYRVDWIPKTEVTMSIVTPDELKKFALELLKQIDENNNQTTGSNHLDSITT